MPRKNHICGIYVVTHIESGRKYVGKSSRVKTRWYEHAKDCKKYNGKFSRALAKYGKDAFKWEVIEECPRSVLNDRETYWIAKLDTVAQGFNCTSGGDGILAGFKHSLEERAAKSLRQKGKPHSAEHNKNVSEALKGRQIPPHVVAILRKNAEAMKGTSPVLSEEAIENIRAAAIRRKGIKQPPGSHAKQWETRRAKYGSTGLSPEGLASVALRASTLVATTRWSKE